MRQFVPMTDELLFGATGLPGPLVPYRTGVACWHALVDGCVTLFSSADLQITPDRRLLNQSSTDHERGVAIAHPLPPTSATEFQTVAASACR